MKKVKTALIITGIFLFVLAISAAFVYLFYKSGMIHFTDPDETEYPVRGLAISAEQGEIDWQIYFENYTTDFAFVQATKGISDADEKYTRNWVKLRENGVVTAACHTFTFNEDGLAQAKHFIRIVPVQANTLPPVVSLVLYDDYLKNPLSKEEVEPELTALLEALEKNYGVKPILYATKETYELYLAEGYDDYILWTANDLSEPDIDGHEWTFWQFTDKQSQIIGEDELEDKMKLCVYKGSAEDFSTAFNVKLKAEQTASDTATSSVAVSTETSSAVSEN